MEALISQKYHLCQTQAGNFRFACCSRALESSDWFPLVTHISSHQSGSTASLMVYVRHQHVNVPAFLRTSKQFMEINSTLPMTKRSQKSSNEGPWRFLPFQVYFPRLFVAVCRYSVMFVHNSSLYWGWAGDEDKKYKDHLSAQDWSVLKGRVSGLHYLFACTRSSAQAKFFIVYELSSYLISHANSPKIIHNRRIIRTGQH